MLRRNLKFCTWKININPIKSSVKTLSKRLGKEVEEQLSIGQEINAQSLKRIKKIINMEKHLTTGHPVNKQANELVLKRKKHRA